MSNFIPNNLESIAKFIIPNARFIILVGNTGTGKTTIGSLVAGMLKLNTYDVSITNMTTGEDLTGTHVLQNNATIFKYGPVTQALAKGGVLRIEEMDQCQSNASWLSFIYQLFDERHELVLANGERFPLRNDLYLFMNTNSTERLQASLLSRADCIIKLDYLDMSAESALLVERCGVSVSTANKLAQIAAISRKTLPQQGISPRVLLKFAPRFQNAASDSELVWIINQLLLASFAHQSDRDAVSAALRLKGFIPSLSSSSRKRRGCSL